MARRKLTLGPWLNAPHIYLKISTFDPAFKRGRRLIGVRRLIEKIWYKNLLTKFCSLSISKSSGQISLKTIISSSKEEGFSKTSMWVFRLLKIYKHVTTSQREMSIQKAASQWNNEAPVFTVCKLELCRKAIVLRIKLFAGKRLLRSPCLVGITTPRRFINYYWKIFFPNNLCAF